MRGLAWRAGLMGLGLTILLPAQPDHFCRNDPATQETAKGIAAFEKAEYPNAVEHFRAALFWDAGCASARLHLAAAYFQQYFPGAVTPDNLAMADAAREQFDRILEQEPENQTALALLASLCFNERKLAEATKWYGKLIQVNPDNKEAFYTLGVIVWTRCYQPVRKAREDLGMKPDEPGPIKDEVVRTKLRTDSLPVLEEGLADLERALAIDPEYDDAMAYMNLLYRVRADLEDSPQGYRDDITTADAWFQKVIDTRKAKASRQPPTMQ